MGTGLDVQGADEVVAQTAQESPSVELLRPASRRAGKSDTNAPVKNFFETASWM